MNVNSNLGPVILDLAGHEVAPDEVAILKHPATGGVILFKRNYESPGQLTELVRQVRSIRAELLICVDQEGGRVQRFREGFTRLPPLQAIGNLYAADPVQGLDAAEKCAWLMAAELRAVGLDMSFAPVLDVDDFHSDVIGDRSFGRSVTAVTELGRAYIRGMHAAGMPATAKHFPGHGAIKADSHYQSAVDSRPLAQVVAEDMQPFVNLAGEFDAVMPAHILFEHVDKLPVGFSSVWLQSLLRGRLDFKGVIFSDDLSMQAAACAGDYCGRAAQALAAGCDAILVCNNPDDARKVLEFLKRDGFSASSRLAKLRRDRFEYAGLGVLQQSARWQESRVIIDRLTAG